MRLLMHTCCAPCSVYCIDELRSEGIEPTLYWYNPNIHPALEYITRRDTLKKYSEMVKVNAIFDDEYGLDEFCKNVSCDLANRCVNYCYRVRLEKTAQYAKEHGYDAITTTLFVSIYQKHDAIKKICSEVAEKYGLEFVYRDFRIGFREGQAKARELGLYMQKYCGCVFSEEDSFYAHLKRDKDTYNKSNKIVERNIRFSQDVQNLDVQSYDRNSKEDYDYIYNLENSSYKKYRQEMYNDFNEEARKRLFEKFMKKYWKTIKIITLNGKYVGFYNCKTNENGVVEIVNICIESEYQKKGIGTAILKEILFEYSNKKIELYIFKKNPVIDLYKKFGFEIVDENKDYYQMIKEK